MDSLRRRCAAHYKLTLRRNKRLCLIYQMGKVASSSIASTLRHEGTYNVFHVHRLNPDNIAQVRRRRSRLGLPPIAQDAQGKLLYEKVIRRKAPCKIVTLVREPIGRNMSAFFENARDLDSSLAQQPIDALIEKFLAEYTHDVPLDWFDEEMYATTGLNVYDQPFPIELGHQTISNDFFDLLIMRFDLPDHEKAEALSRFLGIRRTPIRRANIGSGKAYRRQYERFKDSIALPREYVERMLTSDYCRHFHSAAEIETLFSKYVTSRC